MSAFTNDSETMNYKDKIRRSNNNIVSASTKEYMIFSRENKSVRVSFVFDWLYDKEDGWEYKRIVDFSGHARCTTEEQTWLEEYVKQNFPDDHHMSY